MSGLLVRGALLEGERVDLRAEAGRIAAVAPAVEAEPGDEILDGAGRALVPGLVNAHTHSAMTLFRGFADDLPLMTWLERHVWPVEARLDADDVYWGARLACAEMIRTGTTRFWDMYWQPEAVARAVEDAGLRATIGGPLVDFDDPARAPQVQAQASEWLDALSGRGARIAPALTPHSIYTVSEATLRWTAQAAADRGVPVHIHLSETRAEVDSCLAAHGLRPAHYLDSLGLLDDRTLLAHGVHLDAAELGLIAERGATVATNPVANMKLAVGGPFPYAAARERGVAVGLGTDGPGSNNSLDLLSDAKTFALVHKHAAEDPAAVTADETLSIARGARSPLLGGADELRAGDAADFLLVRADSTELGIGGLAAGLVYAASGAVVDATVVDGRVLMRDGVVEDEPELVERARERATRLGIRARR